MEADSYIAKIINSDFRVPQRRPIAVLNKIRWPWDTLHMGHVLVSYRKQAIICNYVCKSYGEMIQAPYFLFFLIRYLMLAVNSSKKSPEVIQLLDMHTHFSSATPKTKVNLR